jgi:hypothetical protein
MRGMSENVRLFGSFVRHMRHDEQQAQNRHGVR